MSSDRPEVVLIVDDDAVNRRLMADLVRIEGREPIVASGGCEALDILERRTVDLVLLDLMMPGMSGLDVLDELMRRGITPALPVVVITALTDREQRVAALQKGAADFLGKPIDRQELACRVRNLVSLKRMRDRLENRGARLDGIVREQAAFWKTLVANVPALVVALEPDGTIVSINGQAQVPLDAVPGQPLDALVLPEHRDTLRRTLQEALAGPGVARCSVQAASVDGAVLDYDLAIAPIHAADRVVALVLVGHDVTERRRAEKTLQDNEERFRRLVEHIHDALFTDDIAGRITFANDQLLALFGFEREQLPHLVFDDFVAPEWREQVRDQHNRRMRGETVPEHFGLEGIRRDGRRLWLDADVVPLLDDTGRVIGTQAAVRDVTERKQAEDALRESEDRYRDLVQHSSDLICTHDLGGNVLSVNPAATRFSGYSPAELLTMNLRDLLDPQVKGQFEKYLSEIRSKGASKGLMLVQARNGERRIWEYDNSLRVQGDQPAIVRGTARDVTESKAAAEALRRSEADLQRAQSIAQVGSWYVHFERDEARWSPESYRIFGIPPETVMTYPGFLASVHPDDRQRVDDRWQAALRGAPYDIEHRILVGDETKWVREYAELETDTSGSVVAAFGTVQDITTRKLAELERALLHDVVARSLNEVYVIDPGTLRFRFVNFGACRNLGYTQTVLAGLTPIDIMPELAAENFRAMLEPLRTGDRPVLTFETVHRRKDGSRYPVQVHLQLVDTGADTVFLAITNDITERRQAEQMLLQSQKIEAIGQLAGGIAHDFNNILSVITIFGELARRQLGLEHPVRPRVDEIMKAAERAAGLTRQLLTFSRKQVIQPRLLDLNGIVTEAQKMLERLIGENIALAVHLTPDLGTVKADPGQVEQIIINLAVNARDAMPKGGSLTIETHNVDLDEEYAAADPSVSPGRYVLLALSDTGTGMDEETRHRIFEPFFTTKSEGQGTGLGLATIYGIVKQSGGGIHVYSELGHGTTFKVHLPRVDAPAETPHPAGRPAGVLGGHETILLVEDNEALREVIRETLEGSGYTVLPAVDGEEGLALAREREGPLDLLLTDVVMPRLGGRDLAKLLSELRPGIRVLYMSGYTNGVITQHGVLREGVLLLEKPFTTEKLARAVREALDRPGTT